MPDPPAMASAPGAPTNLLSATARHYLEAIFYMAQEGEAPRPGRLAEWLGVSHPTVTVTLQKLERAGWLDVAANRSIALTSSGEAAAAAVVRKHRILERWLVQVLGFDWAAADREAESLAPATSDEVIERLDQLLGRPEVCPHGNPIPGRGEMEAGAVRLGELAPGHPARVVRVSEVAEHEAPALLDRLHRLGLFPGCDVVVRAYGPPLDIEVDGRPAEIDAPSARTVWVREVA